MIRQWHTFSELNMSHLQTGLKHNWAVKCKHYSDIKQFMQKNPLVIKYLFWRSHCSFQLTAKRTCFISNGHVTQIHSCQQKKTLKWQRCTDIQTSVEVLVGHTVMAEAERYGTEAQGWGTGTILIYKINVWQIWLKIDVSKSSDNSTDSVPSIIIHSLENIEHKLIWFVQTPKGDAHNRVHSCKNGWTRAVCWECLVNPWCSLCCDTRHSSNDQVISPVLHRTSPELSQEQLPKSKGHFLMDWFNVEEYSMWPLTESCCNVSSPFKGCRTEHSL